MSVTEQHIYTRAQQQAQQQPRKLVIGMAANSRSSHAAADDRASDDDDSNSNSNSCSQEAAVEKREWSGEQLVALKPGHHIGPYRLQVRLFMYATATAMSTAV